MLENLQRTDPQIMELIAKEVRRQREQLCLIASENFASIPVIETMATVLTNKYAEGYSGNRYYGGCSYIDKIEDLAIQRAKNLFKAEHVNVQPHSGSQANMAVYFAVLKPGDTVLGMDLSHGGHLTHGHKVNFSGSLYHFVSYGLDKDTNLINYDSVRLIAQKHRPKLIIAGASAYPRIIDFAKMSEIAKDVGALLLADIAHIAGLIAADAHPSPFRYADFVTTTTHKTLRGPRGGMIFSKQQYAKILDRSVFPGMQGGPLMHMIAAKAVAFQEALQPAFVDYIGQIIKNAQSLANALKEENLKLVTDGTDNHLLLVDLRNLNITGKEAEAYLENVGIVANKNTIPFDTQKPFITSGIRFGVAALTTRGFTENDMYIIGKLIVKCLLKPHDVSVISEITKEVRNMTYSYPLYPEWSGRLPC